MQDVQPASIDIQQSAISHQPSEMRLTLNLAGDVNPSSPGAHEYEIIAITAGDGNGWQFSPAVLKASVELWNDAQVFIDHAGWLARHSLRDLGGVLHSAKFDEARDGIAASLRTFGPSAEVVHQLGLALTSGGPRPDIGFSADISFTARGREVLQITRVHSVDLVYRPARGGAFVRQIFSQNTQGATPMEEEQTTIPQQPALAVQAEETRRVRLQMCTYLLDSGLAASHLPAPMQAHIKAQFAGRIFEPAELTAAIEAARDLVSQLTAGAAVSGPARISGMFSAEDQLQAAVDQLFGVPPDPAASQPRNVPRLSGIRELYLMLTGDDELHGGYYPSRARLATTADFTGLVKNALNKIVVNQWDELGRAGYNWWARVTVHEQFSSLQEISGTLVGTVGSLPAVAEGGEYTELAIGDSPETATFTKYGGYIPLTLELIDRDETRKLRAYPRELANAGLRRISSLVAAIFSDNSGIGPTMADGGALFNNTAVTSAGGHANLLTTALSAGEWEVVSAAVYNQPMLIKNAAGYYGSGAKQAINPKYLLVPRALQLTAAKILYPLWENNSNIYSENLQRGQPGDVVVVPEWTDASDWAAACDPRIAPAIYVGTRFGIMPEVFIAGGELSPAVFMNDEHRLKVRHFVAVWVNDFRPLHKSNV